MAATQYTVETLGLAASSGPSELLLLGFGLGALPPPVADFSGTPLSGNVPLAVQFTDLSTGSPTSWLWSAVGQNTATTYTSTIENPLITFLVVDVYDVTLTATNEAGPGTETKLAYITVTDVPQPHQCNWNPPAATPSDWSVPVATTGSWNSPAVDC